MKIENFLTPLNWYFHEKFWPPSQSFSSLRIFDPPQLVYPWKFLTPLSDFFILKNFLNPLCNLNAIFFSSLPSKNLDSPLQYHWYKKINSLYMLSFLQSVPHNLDASSYASRNYSTWCLTEPLNFAQYIIHAVGGAVHTQVTTQNVTMTLCFDPPIHLW